MKRATGTDVDPAGWRGVAWKAYEYLPRSADALIRVGTRSALPFAKYRVPLMLLRGPVGSGTCGSMLVAGDPEWAEYVTGRFFVADPEREFLGSVPSWRLAGELGRRRDSVDLVVARLDRVSATLFLDATGIVVPEWVGGLLSVPDDPWQLARRSKSLHNNLSRVRRAGFRPSVSHQPEDFQEFFDDMYVPFIRGRYGPEGVVSNRMRMRRCFRQGGVLWALRHGVRVAGALFRTRGRTLDVVVIGTANGDRAPIAAGAAFALDLFLFEHARAIGCDLFDFGGSRPSLRDGVLLYKARFGTRVIESRTAFYDLCLSWNRLNAVMLSFLARTPLIFRQTDGLSALWSIAGNEGTMPAAIREHRSVLRSLRRLYLVGVPPAEPLEPDLETIVIDPERQPAWYPPRAVR